MSTFTKKTAHADKEHLQIKKTCATIPPVYWQQSLSTMLETMGLQGDLNTCLVTFWSEVFNSLSSVSHISCASDPKLALLGVDIEIWLTRFQTFITHTFIAARLAIVKMWRNAQIPSMSVVVQTLNTNVLYEYSFANEH